MFMLRLLVIVGFLLTVYCTVPKGMSETVASSQHLKIPSKGNGINIHAENRVTIFE